MESARAGATVETRRGSVATLHALDPFDDGPPGGVAVWRCGFDGPAFVLGSRQGPDLLDLDACAASGLAVVRRRSGGGAVLLRPEAVVWIDLVVPAGIAPDDVRGSMVWAGGVWAEALVRLGAARDALHVHAGGMVTTPWSELVCFAGVGPGEVLFGGRKLVGLSQRRTRHGIRVQGQVHLRAIVDETARYLAVPTPDTPLPRPAVLDEALGASPWHAETGDVAAEAIGEQLARSLATSVAAATPGAGGSEPRRTTGM